MAQCVYVCVGCDAYVGRDHKAVLLVEEGHIKSV